MCLQVTDLSYSETTALEYWNWRQKDQRCRPLSHIPDTELGQATQSFSYFFHLIYRNNDIYWKELWESNKIKFENVYENIFIKYKVL